MIRMIRMIRAHARWSSPPSGLLRGLALASLGLTACNYHSLKSVELEKVSELEERLQLVVNKDVDVLFVIDNSGSMGEEQALLASNFGAFIEVLEAENIRANYRIGVTTTDNGNALCTGTTPEGGKLVLSPCTERLDDFIFGAGSMSEDDKRDRACNDICDLSAEELEILPTTTERDDTPRPRKWLEHIEGKKNIPAATSMVDAFKCFGPQGIDGCGFESQLESMYLALVRSENEVEKDPDNYGFLRTNAILAVVVVTDEADCSLNKTYSEIFDPDGSRLFWSDPNAAYPTSAVCWNAGVTCTGDPSGYESCEAVNKDVDRNEGVEDANAVLHPIARYVGRLQAIEDAKQALNPTQEVLVSLIGGVGPEGELVYAETSDAEFMTSFGIGPGCENVDIGSTAVPPVRLRDVVGSFGTDNMFSICEADYSIALEAIARQIEDRIVPACYTLCAEDTDPSTETLEADCIVTEDLATGESERVAECLTDASGDYVIDPETGEYAMPEPGVNVCYAMLTDDSMGTSSTVDDMSDLCVESHYNLEFKLARRPGYPALAGTAITATCSLADFPELTCPGIGG